jgi:heparan-alpha-glucosaminide N-acetyltransferase
LSTIALAKEDCRTAKIRNFYYHPLSLTCSYDVKNLHKFILFLFLRPLMNEIQAMTTNDRVYSIDIIKGLALIMMLLLTDLFSPVIPKWYVNLTGSRFDPPLYNPAFFLFLFTVGMTIPYAISKRINNGLQQIDIIKQIIARTIIYLLIGVLMVNAVRVEPVMTGIGKNLWSLLMFTAVFLVWNKYRENDSKFFTISGLRLIGLAVLVFLVFKFRSDSPENNGSLVTGWWGIIGLIGWGFLVGSMTYMAVRNSIFISILIWVAFLSLHILTNLNMLGFLNPVKPYLGVIFNGYIPCIVISGVIVSMLIRRFPAEDSGKLMIVITGSGLLMISVEFVLKRTGVFADHLLMFLGASLLLFALLFFIVEIKKIRKWSSFLRPAWENPVTAYIILFFLYSMFAFANLRVMFYKDSENPFIMFVGSAVLTAIVILITSFLKRLNIRLKI